MPKKKTKKSAKKSGDMHKMKGQTMMMKDSEMKKMMKKYK